MSRFTEKMYRNARTVTTGMVTGEPHEPIRHTWGEVHERARCIAGGLAAAGVGHGDAVGVLAGFPVEIAPTAQGLWMRGASLTMLHQPTPRTDLVIWAEDTMTVIGMIEAKAVIVSEPFTAAIPVLEGEGHQGPHRRRTAGVGPVDPIEVGEDDLALMQLTSGSTGSPKAVQITHRNIYSNAEAMFIGAEYDVDNGRHGELAALLPRHGHGRLPDHPDVLRRRTGQGHPDGLPARHPAVGPAHRQVQGHHDRGAELRLCAVRQAAAQAGQAGRVRPVDAAVRAVGRRAGGARRRRGPHRCGQAVRPAARRDPAGLRHGRDDAGGVVLRVRRRPGRRRGRRRPAGRAAPRGARHQGQHPQAGLAGSAARRPRGSQSSTNTATSCRRAASASSSCAASR